MRQKIVRFLEIAAVSAAWLAVITTLALVFWTGTP